MANEMVSQYHGKHDSLFPECFVQDAYDNYEPDPAAVVRQYGWVGDPWRTRATMVQIRLNQKPTSDCPAYFLSLSDSGDMYLTQATEHAVLPVGTKLVAGLTKRSSIDRIALRLQETASHAT